MHIVHLCSPNVKYLKQNLGLFSMQGRILIQLECAENCHMGSSAIDLIKMHCYYQDYKYFFHIMHVKKV